MATRKVRTKTVKTKTKVKTKSGSVQKKAMRVQLQTIRAQLARLRKNKKIVMMNLDKPIVALTEKRNRLMLRYKSL
jgi:hypothetical protein